MMISRDSVEKAITVLILIVIIFIVLAIPVANKLYYKFMLEDYVIETVHNTTGD